METEKALSSHFKNSFGAMFELRRARAQVLRLRAFISPGTPGQPEVRLATLAGADMIVATWSKAFWIAATVLEGKTPLADSTITRVASYSIIANNQLIEFSGDILIKKKLELKEIRRKSYIELVGYADVIDIIAGRVDFGEENAQQFVVVQVVGDPVEGAQCDVSLQFEFFVAFEFGNGNASQRRVQLLNRRVQNKQPAVKINQLVK